MILVSLPCNRGLDETVIGADPPAGPEGSFPRRLHTMDARWLSMLAVALFLAPYALAGDASSPEITDARDASNPALDVTSAWFTTTGANSVTLTIKLADLSDPNPITRHDTEAVRYYYQVDM